MKTNDFIKDQCGLLHSSELILSIIILVFIIGIVANLSDGLNEKILSEEEIQSLDVLAIETSDYLLTNPGNPENWEEDDGLDNGIVSEKIIPGLAIKNKNLKNGEFLSESSSDEMIMSNAISYRKLIKVKSNYNSLVGENLFNGNVHSSMAIYPLNSEIRPLEMGEIFDNVNDNNIAVVNRTVKCDYYSSFALYNFNDFELLGEDYEDGICNHDSNPNLKNHDSDERSFWLCKNFRVNKESLDEYDYYLISDESVKSTGTYYILESLNRTNENKESLNREVIELNSFFMKDMENSSSEIYSIHFNVMKNRISEFKTVLVAIPKNMTDVLKSNDELDYDYFRVQDVNFVLKVAYK